MYTKIIHLIHLHRVYWVTKNTLKYSIGTIVTLAIGDDDLPVFGEVKEILLYNTSMIIFLTEELSTDQFHHHYHAYEVSRREHKKMHVTQFSSLVDHVPLSLLKSCDVLLFDSYFVLPRYNINWT